MLIINVKGLVDLSLFAVYIDKDIIKNAVCEIIASELDIIIKKIRHDPKIPQEYKDALFLSVSPGTGYVFIGVFLPTEMKWVRFGVLQYKEYTCTVRQYYGGALTPAYSGLDYIKQIWEEEKASILKNIKDRTAEYIRTSVGRM
uniref:Uncharacterized protein n=1 Tax=viral metagenome TaxID=1070528 RepID=A0A6H1ZK88_9ZZZZ